MRETECVTNCTSGIKQYIFITSASVVLKQVCDVIKVWNKRALSSLLPDTSEKRKKNIHIVNNAYF